MNRDRGFGLEAAMAGKGLAVMLFSGDAAWERQARGTDLAAALCAGGRPCLVAAPKGSLALERAERLGVERRELPLGSRHNPLEWLALARFLRRSGVSVLHAQDNIAVAIAAKSTWISRKTVRVATVDTLDEYSFRRFRYSSMRGVIFPSRAAALVGASGTGERITIPAGVDLEAAGLAAKGGEDWKNRFKEKFCPGKEKPLLVAVVAPLGRESGLEALLDVMPDILVKLPQTHLAIMGDGSLGDDLGRRIRITALENDVVILEPGAEAGDLVAAADLFVLPASRDASGWAAKLAMASGTACVLGRGGCLGELAEDGKTALYTIDDDPRNLCSAILELLENRNRREHIGRMAAAWAARSFGVRAEAEQTLEFYSRFE